MSFSSVPKVKETLRGCDPHTLYKTIRPYKVIKVGNTPKRLNLNKVSITVQPGHKRGGYRKMKPKSCGSVRFLPCALGCSQCLRSGTRSWPPRLLSSGLSGCSQGFLLRAAHEQRPHLLTMPTSGAPAPGGAHVSARAGRSRGIMRWGRG